MKKNLLFLFALTTIFSCKKDMPLTFSETNFASEEHTVIEINIPKFEENTEASKGINYKIMQFVGNSISSYQDDIKVDSFEEIISDFNSDYIEFIEKLGDAPQPWEALIDGEVTYQSSKIICIAISTYTNTGGAHGNSVISFLNFSPSNGELYKNEELINDMSSLKTIAESHFKKVINELEDSDKFEFQFPETIGFSEDGVIILLNSNGLIVASPEFTIPYEEVSDLLKVH